MSSTAQVGSIETVCCSSIVCGPDAGALEGTVSFEGDRGTLRLRRFEGLYFKSCTDELRLSRVSELEPNLAPIVTSEPTTPYFIEDELIAPSEGCDVLGCVPLSAERAFSRLEFHKLCEKAAGKNDLAVPADKQLANYERRTFQGDLKVEQTLYANANANCEGEAVVKSFRATAP